MNLTSIKENIKKRGLIGAIKSYTKKFLETNSPNDSADSHPYTILLLTNKDSDNVGDQVIEACDVSILHAIMKNLNITNYKIVSKPATIVKEPYDQPTGAHLDHARQLIQESDIVIYGGTPVFNYLYQTFYKLFCASCGTISSFKSKRFCACVKFRLRFFYTVFLCKVTYDFEI